MHPNEICIAVLDADTRKRLRREAEKMGPRHLAALAVQYERQGFARAWQLAPAA
jgi:glucose-6-phosphate dehydrogenase assembly protein OpcA